MLSTTGKFFAFGLLALVTCTGCLREPFHGQTYSSRTNTIDFWGGLASAYDYVEIEVRNPRTGSWDFLTSTYSGGSAYPLPTGTWYVFQAQKQIPFSYWVENSGEFSSRVRAVTEKGALLTLNASWKDTEDLSVNGPLVELANKHLHGQEVTIYAGQ